MLMLILSDYGIWEKIRTQCVKSLVLDTWLFLWDIINMDAKTSNANCSKCNGIGVHCTITIYERDHRNKWSSSRNTDIYYLWKKADNLQDSRYIIFPWYDLSVNCLWKQWVISKVCYNAKDISKNKINYTPLSLLWI